MIKLRILGRPNTAIIEEINSSVNLPEPKSEDEVWLLIDYSEYNVKVGQAFHSFLTPDQKDNFEIEWTLRSVLPTIFVHSEELPLGYKSICLFQLRSGVEIIDDFPEIESWIKGINCGYITE